MEESIPKLWDRGEISSREDTVKEQSPIQLQCRRGQPWDEASCCLRIAMRIRCRLCGALGQEVLSEANLPATWPCHAQTSEASAPFANARRLGTTSDCDARLRAGTG